MKPPVPVAEPEESTARQLSISLRWFDGPVASFDQLISGLPDETLSSPRRSTIALLDYWRTPAERLIALWRQLGLPLPEQADLRFEHATPVRKGRGKASFTDLMIVADRAAIAVEAKFTEPPYEKVSKWLSPKPSDNRVRVLEGWLEAIGNVFERQLTVNDVRELPYQLVHRTASVCCFNRPTRWLIYQLFGTSHRSYYANQLVSLAKYVSPRQSFGVVLLQYDLRPTSYYERLDTDWRAGRGQIDGQVRAALRNGPLFEFSEPVVTTVVQA